MLRYRSVLTEAGLLAVVGACYLAIRFHTVDRTDEAVAHARDVLALQERLGLDWERAVQDATLSLPWVSTFFAEFYVWGYFPVLITVMLWLFLRRRDSYLWLRNAYLASGAVGFTIQALYPCAPPRLTGTTFTDTVASRSLDALARPIGVSNELGAMPSFHVGWLMLAGVVVFRLTRSPLVRALCLALPALMAYSVVATGNHWVLDIPAGIAVAGIGALVARLLDRRSQRRTTEPATPAGPAPDALRA